MLEICAFHLQDFHTAVASGADRLEVCVEYEHGGLTPPSEWIRVLHETYPHIPLVSMARPRGGDFCYSDKEWDQLSADAVELRDAGSAAIVFGCLTADHKLDIPRCQQLITHLKCPCVLHRAFDEIEDPLSGVEDAISAGFVRILTGQGMKDMKILTSIAQAAAGRVDILPGGGVRCHNMDAYTSAGFCALHSSCITSGSASGGGPGRDGHFGGENRINGAEVASMALRMRCQARSGGGRVV